MPTISELKKQLANLGQSVPDGHRKAYYESLLERATALNVNNNRAPKKAKTNNNWNRTNQNNQRFQSTRNSMRAAESNSEPETEPVDDRLNQAASIINRNAPRTTNNGLNRSRNTLYSRTNSDRERGRLLDQLLDQYEDQAQPIKEELMHLIDPHWLPSFAAWKFLYQQMQDIFRNRKTLSNGNRDLSLVEMQVDGNWRAACISFLNKLQSLKPVDNNIGYWTSLSAILTRTMDEAEIETETWFESDESGSDSDSSSSSDSDSDSDSSSSSSSDSDPE